MSGRLLNQARKDARKFLTSGGFEDDMILQNPTGNQTIELKCIHTKHFIGFDGNGNQINSKNAHILISEKDLIELNYTYRNSRTLNIDLYKHKVTVKNQNGDDVKFVINESYPSETLGLIVCILGDRE